MHTGRTDFLVGLFILGALGVTIGVLVLTSGLLERHYMLHMRVATAEGLSQDTRVILQGLAIGRVSQVNPQLDQATSTLNFVAELSIRERFPDGTRLRLPVGTKAVITQPTPIVVSPIIDLVMPPASPDQAILQPGDTIDSERPPSVLDAISSIASTLSRDIGATLEETRQLVTRSIHTVDEISRLLATTSPQLESTLARLAESLDHAERIMSDIEPRVGPLADSMVATFADTRQVLLQLDSLATIAHGMATDNRVAISESIKHLHRSAIILENLVDQLSRRPLRALTGVTPPPDTANYEP